MTEVNVSHIQIKIAVCGNADAGKSTLIGTLVTNKLDDGNGLSRKGVLKCQHEKESGRTSSITHSYIRYSISNSDSESSSNTDTKKEINLIDLAGQDCYLKTTSHGITGNTLDYALVIVGANMGMTDTTREHLLMLIWLNIPFIVVMTKDDICPPLIKAENLKKIKNLSKVVAKQESNMGTSLSNKNVIIMDDESKMTAFLSQCNDPSYFNTTIPVIIVSSKTGSNIDNIHNMFKNLMSRHIPDSEEEKSSHICTYIEQVYQVPYVGLVITSTLPTNSPPLHIDSILHLGPRRTILPRGASPSNKREDRFVPVRIRGLHDNNKTNISIVYPGQSFCANIKFTNTQLNRRQIFKGFVLTSDPRATGDCVSTKFKANIRILSLKTTIGIGYCPLIHFKTICQPAKIIAMENESGPLADPIIGHGSAIITFEFTRNQEYIEPGVQLFFRDKYTKGTGKIISAIFDS